MTRGSGISKLLLTAMIAFVAAGVGCNNEPDPEPEVRLDESDVPATATPDFDSRQRDAWADLGEEQPTVQRDAGEPDIALGSRDQREPRIEADDFQRDVEQERRRLEAMGQAGQSGQLGQSSQQKQQVSPPSDPEAAAALAEAALQGAAGNDQNLSGAWVSEPRQLPQGGEVREQVEIRTIDGQQMLIWSTLPREGAPGEATVTARMRVQPQNNTLQPEGIGAPWSYRVQGDQLIIERGQGQAPVTFQRADQSQSPAQQ